QGARRGSLGIFEQPDACVTPPEKRDDFTRAVGAPAIDHQNFHSVRWIRAGQHRRETTGERWRLVEAGDQHRNKWSVCHRLAPQAWLVSEAKPGAKAQPCGFLLSNRLLWCLVAKMKMNIGMRRDSRKKPL